MAKTDPLDFPGFPVLPLGGWSAQPQVQHLGKDDDDEDDEDDIDVDDSDDDDSDDEEDEDDSDDDDDEDDEDDVEKLRAALKKERTARRAAEKKSKSVKTPAAKPKAKGKKDDDEDDEVDRRISAVEERANSRIKRTEARSALKDANLAEGVSIESALRLLDLDELEVDDDGEVIGLDDALADLKEDSPALFAKATRSRRRRDSAAGRDSGDKDRTPKSATERQAEALRRGAPKRR